MANCLFEVILTDKMLSELNKISKPTETVQDSSRPALIALGWLFMENTLMKKIPLSKDKHTIVDDEDYEKLSKYKWHYSGGYAHRFHVFKELPLEQIRVSVSMARIIMGLYNDDKREVDHKNRNRLDNRKSNLRICNRSQNMANKLSLKGSSSKYKGVVWVKRDKIWRAGIGLNYKIYHIGYFDSEIEAAKAYDKKAKELFGEFACLNFPLEKR